jgi:hypothetical protein
LDLDIFVMAAWPDVFDQVRGMARWAHRCCCICGLWCAG